jgi:DNA polymerase-3 subunit chi
VTVHLFTGLDDPWAWALRVVRKAQREGRLLWVLVPGADVNRVLSRWCAADPQGFLSLAPPRAAMPVRRHSRIHVFDADEAPNEVPSDAHLLHLAPLVHPLAASFDTVLDAVGLDDTEVQAGRRRFRAYQAMGLEVRHRPTTP